MANLHKKLFNIIITAQSNDESLFFYESTAGGLEGGESDLSMINSEYVI